MKLASLLLLAPLVVVGCERLTPSEILVAGLHAAAAGDPAAWGYCSRLEQGQGRGLCKVAASAAMPDRAAACEAIVRPYWRGECWFEYAESFAEAGRWDAAIAACGEAELFVGDCARHLWWIADSAGEPAPGLRDKLLAMFPGEVAPDPVGAATVAPPSEPRPARVAGGWANTFKEAARIDTAECPATARAECVAAAREAFTSRWRRALGHGDDARLTLCTDLGHVGERLQAHGDPELEAVLVELRGEVCGR